MSATALEQKIDLDDGKPLRRLVVFVVGGTVLLFGLILFFLPGPSILVIPAGLAILATEFVWARRLLSRFRWQVRSVKRTVARVRGGWKSP